MTIETGFKQTLTLSDTLNASEECSSLFEDHIRDLNCDMCELFKGQDRVIPCSFENSDKTLEVPLSEKTKLSFPSIIKQNQNDVLKGVPRKEKVRGKKVAVLFSGGPAAGGHNVIAGLKKVLGEENELWGIKAGPKGLLDGDLFLITNEDVSRILNLGGFDFLGSDRTKIKTEEQFNRVRDVVNKHQLDGLVIVGGDDSNTNAAFLAEKLMDLNCQVIGVPKTIDGDLQVGDLLPISFGFDTATKLYAELVGNILQDTPSSRKYWHFVKLMGRSASHVTLEVALQTHPQVVLISEEVAQKKQTLNDIVHYIADIVIERAKSGRQYGLVLIPEGLIEFIPELTALISHINQAIGQCGDQFESMTFNDRLDSIMSFIPLEMVELFRSLPLFIQENLLSDRDAHGNLKVSQIPTEALLVDMVSNYIKDMQVSDSEGSAQKAIFSPLTHFFGYEGRCGAPSRFDASFTFNLGLIAGSLILDGKTGYMAALTSYDSGGVPLAIPLTGLIICEEREGKESMVIEKALVRCEAPAFQYLESRRKLWAKDDLFSSPGPIQHWGPTSQQLPISVALNQGYESLNYTIK